MRGFFDFGQLKVQFKVIFIVKHFKCLATTQWQEFNTVKMYTLKEILRQRGKRIDFSVRIESGILDLIWSIFDSFLPYF